MLEADPDRAGGVRSQPRTGRNLLWVRLGALVWGLNVCDGLAALVVVGYVLIWIGLDVVS